MFLLKILSCILVLFGFAIFSVCVYSSWHVKDYNAVAISASIPVGSIIAWFLLPSYHIWIIAVNCLVSIFIIGGLAYAFALHNRIKMHFMVKQLVRDFEAGDTEYFEELYQKVNGEAKRPFPNIWCADHFRFIMLKYDIGRYNNENDFNTLLRMVTRADISKAEYEKYKDRIVELQLEEMGIVYGYGTDRNFRSKSGAWDIWRFRSRILS